MTATCGIHIAARSLHPACSLFLAGHQPLLPWLSPEGSGEPSPPPYVQQNLLPSLQGLLHVMNPSHRHHRPLETWVDIPALFHLCHQAPSQL
jgi:hypothetical protein